MEIEPDLGPEEIDLMKRAGLLANPETEPYIKRDPDLNTDEKIQLLVAAGSLTERQAEAYVYRDVEDCSRDETADRMGLSSSSPVDDYRRAAQEKIRVATMTQKVVEVLQDDG